MHLLQITAVLLIKCALCADFTTDRQEIIKITIKHEYCNPGYWWNMVEASELVSAESGEPKHAFVIAIDREIRELKSISYQ